MNVISRVVSLLVLPVVMATTFSATEESAWGGTYAVAQCDSALGIASSGFAWQATGSPSPIQQAGSACTEFGLAVRTSNVGTAQAYPLGAYGGYFVAAPPNTRIREFSGMFGTLSNCCTSNVISRVVATEFADGAGLRSTIADTPFNNSTWPAASGSVGPVLASWSSGEAGFEARRIGYYIACATGLSCSQDSGGESRIRARSFVFSIEDLAPPVVDAASGTLLSPGWMSGTRTLEVSASDAGGGLAELSAHIGEEISLKSPSACEKVGDRYVSLRPCPLDREATWSVDTTQIPDGEVPLVVSATDVGDDATGTDTSILVDNSAPGAPELVVVGGSDWSVSNEFEVGWSAPSSQHSPIARVHYEVCSVDDAAVCEVDDAPASGSNFQIDVPERGVYRLDVWLEDAAGNSDRDTASSVELRFDDTQPAQADIAPIPGWLGLNAVGITMLEITGPLDAPASGVAGFSVTTDGSVPDETVDMAGSSVSYSLGSFPEGITVVLVKAISGAGVASESASATIKVDRSAPTAGVHGLPPAGSWITRPLSAELRGTDQALLSGMDGAAPNAPVESGAYISYAVDGDPPVVVRGDRATAHVSQDGRHELVIRTQDSAGNISAPSSWDFKIDQTAPTGAFDRQDSADPRKVSVSVSDALSGVADGHVELRRMGGRFARLPTSRAGGKLVARLDDLALERGQYELRAIVRDVAGNRAVIGQRAGGEPMTLNLPVRAATVVTAEVRGAIRRCKPAKRTAKRGRRSKRRCRTVVRGRAVAFGKRSTSHGKLTSRDGAPLANAAIVIDAQLRSGGPFTRLGAVRTDATGAFRFPIPAGPSRTVRYRYDGTNTMLPAAATRTTKVAAAARLSASRRRVRNGEAVRFKGRLLGKPIPKAGKVLALQAKVGRRWRTFATPRANAKGVFKHRYRFTSTTGVRRYAFRALVAREAAYPYERGTSKTVQVTVRGR